MAETAASTSPSWGDTLKNLVDRSLDTAAAYGAAKIAAADRPRASSAPIRSDQAAAATAAAGSSTAPAASSLPKWVLPLGIVAGGLLLVGLVWKLFRK